MFSKKTKEKEDKIEITYEQFIAGALLKFGNLDNVDIYLLREDFESRMNAKITGLWYSISTIGSYIEVSESEAIVLNCDIENNRVVRGVFVSVAGDIVNNYFKCMNVEKFKEQKKEKLIVQKAKLLNDAQVLLISDSEEDYQCLLRYGFKNIDYFRSIIRADRYFKQYPKQLGKYHIILTGNRNVQRCCLEGRVDLENTINELRYQNNMLEASLSKYEYTDHIEWVSYLYSRIQHCNSKIETNDVFEIFDRLLEASLINHTLDRNSKEEFLPYEDYVNPVQLELPKKKSDLRILYLETYDVSDYTKEIAEELGLNVDFKEDNNAGLGRYIKNSLGDYDIIIVSNNFSSAILMMNKESTEQCKDSGRRLTLLTTYDFDNISTFDEDNQYDSYGFGDEVTLHYIDGGVLSTQEDAEKKEYRVLRSNGSSVFEDSREKFIQSKKNVMRTTLEQAVILYNEALKKSNKGLISDIDFKSAEEYDKEYALFEEAEEIRKKIAIEPIVNYDAMCSSVSYYLDYKKRGLITEIPENIEITESKTGIKVDNIYQGRIMCSITFPKSHIRDKNLRIFDIQTMSKKGKLSEPETVALYTRKYEGFENIPKRPNEKQNDALRSIEKKVSASISPLNTKAREKIISHSVEKQKRKGTKKPVNQ